MAVDKFGVCAAIFVVLGIVVIRCSDAKDAEEHTAKMQVSTNHDPAFKGYLYSKEEQLNLCRIRLRGLLERVANDSANAVHEQANGNDILVRHWVQEYKTDMQNAIATQDEIDKLESDGVK